MLNSRQEKIHRRALEIAGGYLRNEFELIDILNEVELSKAHKSLGCSSLFKYATDILGLSESTAYALIAVARKSREVPEIKTLPVSKASRIVPVLTAGNASEWLAFARGHSKREIESEIARRHPQNARPEKVKPLTGDLSELLLTVNNDFLAKLNRVLDLEAQRTSKAGSRVAALEAGLDEYLFRRDPVAKARRAEARRAKHEDTNVGEPPREYSVPEFSTQKLRPGRVPLTAAERHAVFARDQGECTYKNGRGVICKSRRWIQVHHIRTIADGGTNDPENLTTLCSYHHDLVHQMSLDTTG